MRYESRESLKKYSVFFSSFFLRFYCNSFSSYFQDLEELCPASKIMRMSGVQSGNAPLVYVSTGPGFASNQQTLTSGPLLKSLTVLFRSFDTVASRAGIVNADTYFVFNVIKQIVQCGKKTAKPILSHLPNDLVRLHSQFIFYLSGNRKLYHFINNLIT